MATHETEIDGLIDEHRQLMSLIAALRRAAGAPDSEDELLDQLEAALQQHTEREEQGLFHTLQVVEVPTEYVGLFEHDHTHLFDLLESARRDRQDMERLVASLEAHMGREEADMFPAADQILGPADWEAIETAVADLR